MKKLVEQPRKANATLVEDFYNEAPEELDSPFFLEESLLTSP